jgi:predicted RNA-binding protein with PIN domain
LPHLKEIFQRDKERARDELSRIARNIHDCDVVRVTLVFDGTGIDHEIVRPGKELTFSYLFSATSSSADSVIVGIVTNDPEPSDLTVVTKDQAILHAALEKGATVIGPEEFLSWADSSASEEGSRATQTRNDEEGRFGTDLDSLLQQ